MLGQARHSHNIAGKHHYKACTGRNLYVFYGHGKVFWGAQKGGVVGKTVLGLCHTYGKFVKSQISKPRNLLLGRWQNIHAFSAVNARNKRKYFILNACVNGVREREIAIFFFTKTNDFMRQLFAAPAAVSPNGRKYGVYAKFPTFFL